MLKKIRTIFLRDLKVNRQDFISLYILVIPILFGILINLFSPGINETTIRLAMIDEENSEKVEYFEQFAEVEGFKDEAGVKARVNKRDATIGLLADGDRDYLVVEGNESDEMVRYAKLLLTFHSLGLDLEDSKSRLVEYDRTVPPLKKTLVDSSILMISILAGMLIALNIVEEKVDRTISAINVTPTSRLTFLLGKSIIGIVFSILGSLALIWITGFGQINWLQLLLVLLVTTLLSILVGIIQGLSNTDVIGTASSIKLLFLPLLAGVLALELLADKWQKFFYWNPFYWAYKGNDAVLAQTASWNEILLYSGLVLLITSLVFVFIVPRIQKALE